MLYEAISESAQPQAFIIIYFFIINFIIILLLMLINIIMYRQVIEGTGRIVPRTHSQDDRIR